ncbi:MAG: hypothetical protein AAF611_11200 [Bacteroidota bacterium]
MGIFNLFNKPQQAYTDFKTIMVDEIYLISVPDGWSQFKSDRFRMKSKNNKIQFSITNYGKNVADLSDSERAISTIDDLKNQFLPLFKKFINEGGFISNNDLEIGKDYIYQSFKVDK